MERSRVVRGIVHVRCATALRRGEKREKKEKKNEMCFPR